MTVPLILTLCGCAVFLVGVWVGRAIERASEPPHIHTWGSWINTQKGELFKVSSRTGEKHNAGEFVHQERYCTACNKVELRVEEAWLDEY